MHTLFLKLKTFVCAGYTKLGRMSLFFVLFLTLLPVFSIAGYRSIEEFNEHNEWAFSQRERVALSAVAFVEQKLHCVIEVSTSLSDTAVFKKIINDGKWANAIDLIEQGLSQYYYYVDTATLYDREGVFKASTSGNIKNIGKSFASEDYYARVAKDWESYISDVSFKKNNEHWYGFVSISVPVLSEEQDLLGVLVLDIKLDTLNGWFNGIDTGRSGFIYAVDQKGKLITHPVLPFNEEAIDYSESGAVRSVLDGRSGVEVMSDPNEKEKQLTAYAPIHSSGWGVVVLQPVSSAFADRNRTVLNSILVFGFIVALTGFFVFRILRSKAIMKLQSDREQRLIDSLGDGVVATDKKWNITLWNKSASVITGWAKEEVLGKQVHPILKLIRERDRKEVLPLEYAFVEKKASSLDENTLLVKKDGSEVPVGDSAAPILNDENMPDGAIIIFRDLSEEREANHLRSDFAYATHQLRTPVTEALWNLDVAIDEKDPIKLKEDIEIVHQSLQSVKKLTEDLVDVSEIDQGSVSVSKAPVKLIDILTDVQNKLATKAKKLNVAVFIAPVSPLAAINTDPKFLKKALVEIIENAITYSKPNTEVIVESNFHEKEIIIEVVDTGTGIPEEQQPLIFTKFFRGSNSGKKGAGSGLGLFLAKESIRLIGGKIWFTSREEGGTTFYISLPIV